MVENAPCYKQVNACADGRKDQVDLENKFNVRSIFPIY